MRRLIPLVIVAVSLAFAAPAGARTKLRFFKSPSGNVNCMYSSADGPGPFIRCDVLSAGDVGFFLRRRGKGKRHMISDSVIDPRAKRLAYGKRRRFGRFTCRSYRSGLKCVNRRNHHGFKLSRQTQRLF
jgi:hypothetical protein